jgi:hypothetical protein
VAASCASLEQPDVVRSLQRVSDCFRGFLFVALPFSASLLPPYVKAEYALSKKELVGQEGRDLLPGLVQLTQRPRFIVK